LMRVNGTSLSRQTSRFCNGEGENVTYEHPFVQVSHDLDEQFHSIDKRLGSRHVSW
jgi:hypothetical protein